MTASGLRRPHATLALCALLALPAAGETAQPEPEAPPGERIQLTDGRLFVPEGFPAGADGFTLVLHLHGAAWAAERNLVRSGLQASEPAVGVTVVLPGLSAAYGEKFRDRAVFPRILEETRARLAGPDGKAPRLRRVLVTSFSAGFGGVRELLADPEAFARIDGLVMADSIHAGFEGEPAARQVNRAQMEGFARFAREAAAGRKRLVITHTALHTPGYASTTETADYLLRQLGGEREPASGPGPGELPLLTRFRRGGLEIYGCAGNTGAEHMRHLHGLWAFLERLGGRPQGQNAVPPGKPD